MDPLAQDRADAIAKIEAIVNGNDNKEVQKMLVEYRDYLSEYTIMSKVG